jgi:hypothetical protein
VSYPLCPVEVVVKRLLLLAGASLLLAACAESSTAPAPRDLKSAKAHQDGDLECRSGYVVAYDADGNPYCTPE